MLLKNKMKIVVTGASGLLGREVLKALKQSDKFSVVGTCFKRSTNPELHPLDITSQEQLLKLFHDKKVN
ncbi:MAT2B [Bugula neritina]|uniref:MAT2B n=1 Tax=Bugula neritina TaxID=10212 RepID=A0A7J7KR69_BUGNE|nr:MAT2B [Bugula neritina]